MLVQPLVDGGEPRLFRVEVRDVGAKQWTVELGKAGAATLRAGDRCYMLRPHDMSAAQIRALPQVIPLTVKKEKSKSGTTQAQTTTRSLTNLSMIGSALQLFVDFHDFWPPAVLVGPDGKPWHSCACSCFQCSGTGTCSTNTISRSPGIARRTFACSTKCPSSSTTRSTAKSPVTSRTTPRS